MNRTSGFLLALILTEQFQGNKSEEAVHCAPQRNTGLPPGIQTLFDLQLTGISPLTCGLRIDRITDDRTTLMLPGLMSYQQEGWLHLGCSQLVKFSHCWPRGITHTVAVKLGRQCGITALEEGASHNFKSMMLDMYSGSCCDSRWFCSLCIPAYEAHQTFLLPSDAGYIVHFGGPIFGFTELLNSAFHAAVPSVNRQQYCM